MNQADQVIAPRVAILRLSGKGDNQDNYAVFYSDDETERRIISKEEYRRICKQWETERKSGVKLERPDDDYDENWRRDILNFACEKLSSVPFVEDPDWDISE